MQALEKAYFVIGQFDFATDFSEQRSKLDPALRPDGAFKNLAQFSRDAVTVLRGPHANSTVDLIGNVSNGNGGYLSNSVHD